MDLIIAIDLSKYYQQQVDSRDGNIVETSFERLYSMVEETCRFPECNSSRLAGTMIPENNI